MLKNSLLLEVTFKNIKIPELQFFAKVNMLLQQYPQGKAAL